MSFLHLAVHKYSRDRCNHRAAGFMGDSWMASTAPLLYGEGACRKSAGPSRYPEARVTAGAPIKNLLAGKSSLACHNCLASATVRPLQRVHDSQHEPRTLPIYPCLDASMKGANTLAKQHQQHDHEVPWQRSISLNALCNINMTYITGACANGAHDLNRLELQRRTFIF